MPTFLFLTSTCLNLDQITHVKIGETPNDDPYCEVFFAAAKASQRFTGEDYRRIIEFMKRHKAE